MAELPGGTVTLLFTDIEGSTRLLHELGERYGDALADHRRLLRACFAARGGLEVDTQGDALFVAFVTASDAVAAAVDAQRALAAHAWPGEVELRVRMGIHTGEPTRTEEGYVGVDLHRGARICSAGHGGQVLVSEATRALLVDRGLEGLELRDLGAHRLQDLVQAQRLYQVVGDGLLAEFPPLRTLENRPTNLPTQPTPLLGRSKELSEIAAFLGVAGRQLVTLTGPGGTGKTRLALQAAADAIDDFPGGVFLVALAAVTDPAMVIPTVAQTLGVRASPGRTIERVLGELFARPALLLLDNFEHVVAAAPAVADLLAVCPLLHVLVTSREPLRLMGEQEYQVPPLPVPDATRLTSADPASVSQYAAVALFVERAKRVRSDFEITNANAPSVAEICVRLDGLPLAIELAAARIKVLTPQAVLDRLGQRLGLLTGGGRDLPGRHQTLRRTIDWSFDLLAESERVLFSRVAVFTDGWTLEAAAAVCDPQGELGVDVLDGLTSLVDKSLVHRLDGDQGGPRFGMLETIREYAQERLDLEPGRDELRMRHAFYFARRSTETATAIWQVGDTARRHELEPEQGNLCGALAWLLDHDQFESADALVKGAWRSWVMHGRLREGQLLVEDFLERSAHSPSGSRADIMSVLGEFYRFQGDYERATEVKEAAMPSLRVAAPRVAAFTLADLGSIAERQGRFEDARRLHEESLALQRELGGDYGEAHASLGLASLAIRLGDLQGARTRFEEVLLVGRRIDNPEFIWESLNGLAEVAWREGRLEEATTLYSEGLATGRAMNDITAMADSLAGMAAVAAGREAHELAVTLVGAVDAVLGTSGLTLYFADERARILSDARQLLDDASYTAAYTKGRGLTADEAAELAREMAPAD